MKKRNNSAIILFICLLPLTIGCKHESIPAGVIDTATFAKFLTEEHLLESYNYIVVSNAKDSLGYQTGAAQDSLLAKYNITKADYDSSMAYYMRHPKILEEVYSRVIDRLNEYMNAVPRNDINSDSTEDTGKKKFTRKLIIH